MLKEYICCTENTLLKTSYKAIASVPGENDGSLLQGDSDGGGEDWRLRIDMNSPASKIY